jgi:hypothetical protein
VVHSLIGENVDASTVFGDDARRGQCCSGLFGLQGQAAARNQQGDAAPALGADVARIGVDISLVGAGEEGGDGIDTGIVVAKTWRAGEVVVTTRIAQDDKEGLQGGLLLFVVRQGIEGCDGGNAEVGRSRQIGKIPGTI